MIFKGVDTMGAVDATFKLYTNDPRNNLVEIKGTGFIRPVPEFIKRMTKVNLTGGEDVGLYKVYPTAHSEMVVERQERVKLIYKIRTDDAQAGELKLVSNDFKDAKYTLRRDPASANYFLEVETEPVGEMGARNVKITLQNTGDKVQTFDIVLALKVPAESLTFAPSVVNCGEVPLSSLKEFANRVGRLGIRKLAGTFKIKAVSSTIQFLKPEIQEMVAGSNYLVRLSTDPQNLPKPGSYEGMIRIETDDAQKPVVEVPVKIVITDK
ncbi:MAG: hypothetical protein AB1757_00930 [Acidobacteriota bacterium]